MIKRLKQYLLFTHRWLGIAMSVLFVMWFISGIVMIYHTFPKPQNEQYFKQQQYLSQNDSIADILQSDVVKEATAVTLEKINSSPVFRFGSKTDKPIGAGNLQVINELSVDECDLILQANFSAPIAKQETITDYDRWIPWSYYKSYFPIQKYTLSDDKLSEVYISSQNGQIVQHTTRLSRWMAYVGAIPHWLYFKQLRLKASLWSEVVIFLSAIGCMMCLSGIIVGFIRFKRRNKKHALDIIPYKKQGLKWHHITGLCFGLFVFTFILSGLMSLVSLPSWMVKKEADINYSLLWSEPTSMETSNAFKSIIDSYPENSVRKIQRQTTMGRVIYKVYGESINEYSTFVADSSGIIPLKHLTENELSEYLKRILPQKNVDIGLLNAYNNDYPKGKKAANILPGYKVCLNDNYNTKLYVAPQTGELLKVSSNHSRSAWWLYQGLHTFQFSVFSKSEGLRQFWLIFISIGGLIMSATGVYIGTKRLVRKLK